MSAAAATAAAPSVYSGGSTVIAMGLLLAEFGMFRQALLRDQVRLYAAQSALISVLAILVAAVRHLPDLYVLAALSAALKVVLVPLVLRRLLRGIGEPGEGDPARGWTEIAGSGSLSLANTVLLAIGVAAFGFFSIKALGIKSAVLPQTALAISASVVLVAFVLMIMRRDVASQAIGFLSLENGISLAGLVVAAGLPLFLEVAFLFDLLVAAVVFELLIRVHHGRAESLSTAELTRLRG
jgi:hydrogenase-4 component E